MQRLFMRSALVLIGALSMHSPSLGQDYYRPEAQQNERTVPARSSNLGGGLIEFLVKGSLPATPRRWTNDRQAQPDVYYVPNQPSPMQAQGAQAGLQRERDTRFQKQLVSYGRKEAPGTIIVDTPHHFLYLVLADGQALRYGIGVGRPGFEWS
ncbi:MAG: hypothetical protein EBY21_05570, partial [Alphaproteobacteria bacterium]|nr:hypothetical protein [Alphaproteobacteria bacterium]